MFGTWIQSHLRCLGSGRMDCCFGGLETSIPSNSRSAMYGLRLSPCG